MKKLRLAGVSMTVLAMAVLSPAYAEEIDHSKMDPSQTDTAQMATTQKTQATGVGVINSVDADGNSINITHEPMPEFGWPEMTMDLPVTRKVNLKNTKKGDKVSFTLKLGRDKKYRVIDMSSAHDHKPTEASQN